MSGLMFIHGFAAGRSVWQLQINALSRDYEITSSLEKVDNNLTVIGWSLGAATAIDLYFKNSKKISSLVLVSAFAKFLKSDDYEAGISPALLRNLERKIQADFDSGIKSFRSLIFNGGTVHPLISSLPPLEKNAVFNELETLKTIDIRAKLGRINVPVLIIHGDKDQISPVASAEYLAKNISGSKLHIFDNVGHAPFLERPNQFNQCVKDFIDNL